MRKVMFKTPVSNNMISNELHIVSYNLGIKKFQNPKFIFCPFMDKQTTNLVVSYSLKISVRQMLACLTIDCAPVLI
jgi:hypothetical protein